MKVNIVGRAREALSNFRYDPPAWSGGQIVTLLALTVVVCVGVYLRGSIDGANRVRANFDAYTKELEARIAAESRARIVRLEAEVSLERTKADAERARADDAARALGDALEAAARAPATQVAGVCETPTAPLNQVIAEVNRGRR